jgi:hypothetical protein
VRGGVRTMLIPAGIPDPANDRTSRLVKSGLKNLSFSKSFDHGSLGIIDSALSTNLPKARVRSRLTVAANPSSQISIAIWGANSVIYLPIHL